MSLLSPEYEGGWTLADHARRIMEAEAWERRQAERAEAAYAKRRQGFALDAATAYERMKVKRRMSAFKKKGADG